VKISFVNDGEYLAWDWIDNVIDYFFMVDIVFNFFVGYYSERKEIWITSWRKIAKRYVKSWFALDLISVLPLDLVFERADTLVFLRLSKLPKLYRIFKIAKLARGMKSVRSQNNIWSRILELLRLNPGVVRIFFNILVITIFCHVFACIWNFAPQFYDSQNTWINNLHMEDATGPERYLTSLYWIFQTVAFFLTQGHYSWIWRYSCSNSR
jgi:hypothetical protein